jgi:hypothetical protein
LEAEEFEDLIHDIEIRCVRKCQKSEQVFNTYGKHSTFYMLMKYGFCEFDVSVVNNNDVFGVEMDSVLQFFTGSKEIERLDTWKNLISEGLESDSSDISSYTSDISIVEEDSRSHFFHLCFTGFDDELLSLLIVLLCDEETFTKLTKDSLDILVSNIKDNTELSQLVLKTIYKLVTQLICQTKPFAEESLKLYEKGTQEWNASVVKFLEYRILLENRKHLEDCLSINVDNNCQRYC